MITSLLRVFTVVAVIVIAGAFAYQQYGTSKGNKLVDEGRELLKEAEAEVKTASPKFTELSSEENTNGFPGNRAKLEPLARTVAEEYGRVAEKYRTAAGKLEEAGKQPADKHVAEYWSLLAQEFVKSADKYDCVRDYALLISDTKVDTYDTLIARRAKLDAKVNEITKVEKELSAKSDKIKAEYPDLLK